MNTIVSLRYMVFAGAIFVLDRITKMIALTWCQSTLILTPFVQCQLVYNHGIVWGFFHEYRSFKIVLICFIIAIIGCVSHHTLNDYRLGKPIVAHIAIITGACCNLIDRLIYGGVIDFIHLKYGVYSWPIFNVADVAIVFGVIWLCITYSDA